MKLSTILAIAAVTEAKKPKTAENDAKKLKGLIDFVWNTWYQNCMYRNTKKGKTDQPKNRYIGLVDRCLKFYNEGSCAAPVADRKRRDIADICINEDGENTCERINKGDRAKAVKQLGNILERWGETWISPDCLKGLTQAKISEKAQKWRDNMNNKVKCWSKDHAINKYYKNKSNQ